MEWKQFENREKREKTNARQNIERELRSGKEGESSGPPLPHPGRPHAFTPLTKFARPRQRGWELGFTIWRGSRRRRTRVARSFIER
jgi:hypothetical protein